MIHGNVWDDYRGRIDIGVIASAWPEFTCRNTGREHWLLGRLGPLAGEIPVKAARDLGIPVICANQCGPTRTTIPIIGLGMSQRIEDRFAGRSTICDGRRNVPVSAGLEPRLLLAEVTVAEPRGLSSCDTTFPLDPAASCSGSG
jgi:N-carbamoylputrescine amidase